MKTPSFTLRGFKSAGEVVKSALGELEREIMGEIWRRGETSVREIHAAFDERAAYTTLMTTLDRLHKKGLLERRKDGRAFLYSPRITSEQMKNTTLIESAHISTATNIEKNFTVPERSMCVSIPTKSTSVYFAFTASIL